ELARRTPPIWIEALSGGEVTQIVTLCAGLRRIAPGVPLLLSSNNDYARSFAREHIPSLDAVFETPWDIGPIVRGALGRVRPRALMFVENVYSPILAKEARRGGIPTVLLSGLVRPAFAPHAIYRRAFGLRFYEHIDHFIVKSPLDAGALAGLGIGGERVRVAGNLKFDDTHLQVPEEETARLRAELGLDGVCPVLVAGSLHEREDGLVLDAFGDVLRRHPGARLLLVPRYNHLLPGIEARLEREGLPFRRRTPRGMEGPAGAPVVLVSTFGELFRLYAVGDAAILGGSFFLRHGVGFSQNIVEPLIHRKPVFFGPFARQFEEITAALEGAWEGLRCRTGEELAAGILRLLEDEAIREATRERIEQILEANRRTLEDHLAALDLILNRPDKRISAG
ncbi:MAG: 3-deoxy-D-manno-octulosonic acid transferase, partial [Nitrospinota bacterium]